MKRQKGSSHCVFDEAIGRAILLSLVVLLAGVDGRAQHGADNWFFGNGAGLDFSSGVPVPLGGAAIKTIEGSAVMSDRNGNLLFYTDGQTVWNRNHVPMPNGMGLLGASSSTQSALIVPWPKTDCKMYFIFTVQEVSDAPPPTRNQTLNYSLVNMSLAGGLGAVTSQKNIQLQSRVSEKLTAVADAAGTGFWVIAHGFDITNSGTVNREFYAYHIGPDGLQKTPRVSLVGSAHSGINSSPSLPHHASQGQMKVSPDGKRIACAVRSRFVEILNFDTLSGTVSGPAQTFTASNNTFISPSVYGVEFSPNSELLYVSITGGSPNQLLQLDLNTNTWSQLWIKYGATYLHDLGALQLGPDKKIYVARRGQTSISVINPPQVVGQAAAFIDGPSLPPGATSELGLPTVIQGDFSCAGDDSREECCDKVSAAPVLTAPNFSVDTKTFTISNLKTPVSAICSIDINMSPVPPFKQGGGLAIDGTAVPAGTRFAAPYNRLPNAGAPTISAVNTVKFSLSIPTRPPAVYTVTFVVKHCDGTQCILTYSPWSVSDPNRFDSHKTRGGINKFALGGNFTSLNTRLNTGTEPGFGVRLAYSLPGPFAAEAEANFFPRDSFPTTLGGGHVTQAFVGMNAGPQFEEFSVFGTAKAGVVSFSEAVTDYHLEREFFFEPTVGRKNLFALNFGGGVELCPGSRVRPRFALGDTITFQPGRNVLGARGLTHVPRLIEHNVQFSSGISYYF